MHVHPVLRWTLKLQQPQLPRSEPDGQPTESPQLGRPNQEFVTQNTVQQTDQSLHVKGAQSVASWSLFLAGLVVGITVCVAVLARQRAAPRLSPTWASSGPSPCCRLRGP